MDNPKNNTTDPHTIIRYVKSFFAWNFKNNTPPLPPLLIRKKTIHLFRGFLFRSKVSLYVEGDTTTYCAITIANVISIHSLYAEGDKPHYIGKYT